jgi:Tfp pilus assembly protein PilF
MLRDAMKEFLERMWKGICEPFVWFAEHLEAFKHRTLPTDTVDSDPSTLTGTLDGEMEDERPRNVREYVRHWIEIARNAWRRFMDPLGSEHRTNEEGLETSVTMRDRLTEYKSQLKHQFGIEGNEIDQPEGSEKADPTQPRGLVGVLWGRVSSFWNWLTWSNLQAFFQLHRRESLLATPVVLLPGFLALVALTQYWTRTGTTTRYAKEMAEAVKDEEWGRTANLGKRLLRAVGPRAVEWTYAFGQGLAGIAMPVEADLVFEAIAPDNDIGYPRAHQKRAKWWAERFRVSQNSEYLTRLQWHLVQSGQHRDEELYLIAAEYNTLMGRYVDALVQTERAAQLNPIHYFDLADLYRTLGNREGGIRAIQLGKSEFAKRLAADPLNERDRVSLAKALAKQSQYDEAERLLRTGIDLQNTQGLHRALGEIYGIWFDQQQGKPNTRLESQLGLLEKGLREDGGSAALYDRWLGMYGAANEAQKETVRRVVEPLCESGPNPAMANFAMSSMRIMDNDFVEAERLLHRALALKPDLAAAKNNLAYLLLTQYPERNAEALRLALEAVGTAPSEASFRETLGSAQLRNGDFAGAIVELEKALPAARNKKMVHAKLAEAYESLGKTEIAEGHRKEADGR